MVKQMQEKFNKYWAGYSLILSCAAILDPRYKLNYVQYCFNTIYGIHTLDFVETILSNLRLLFDEYVKKSKSTSSSLVGSSNVLEKNPDDSSLDEHNVNMQITADEQAAEIKHLKEENEQFLLHSSSRTAAGPRKQSQRS
ncbi:hypothetical protein Gotur_015799 [Gossypium turneri]